MCFISKAWPAGKTCTPWHLAKGGAKPAKAAPPGEKPRVRPRALGGRSGRRNRGSEALSLSLPTKGPSPDKALRLPDWATVSAGKTDDDRK